MGDLIISDYSENTDKEVIEMTGIIKDLSTNTLDLLDNLLDVSKIESGNVTLTLKQHDYLEFIKKQVYINQILAHKKQVKINIEASETNMKLSFDD